MSYEYICCLRVCKGNVYRVHLSEVMLQNISPENINSNYYSVTDTDCTYLVLTPSELQNHRVISLKKYKLICSKYRSSAHMTIIKILNITSERVSIEKEDSIVKCFQEFNGYNTIFD
jgi:hypothetical protein